MTNSRKPSVGMSEYVNSEPIRSVGLPQLPPDAPELIVKHTIPVTEPDRVYIWHKENRQWNFNALVKRYKHQILYGCQDRNCCAPTCYNFRKRFSDAPLRRYTELSARTIACSLASEDHPERGLCRGSWRRGSERYAENRKRSSSSSRALEEPDISASSTSASSLALELNANIEDLSSLNDSRSSTQDDHDSDSQPLRRITKKDNRSFSQALFDTVALQLCEWVPRNPFFGINGLASRAAGREKNDDSVPSAPTTSSDESHRRLPPHLVGNSKDPASSDVNGRTRRPQPHENAYRPLPNSYHASSSSSTSSPASGEKCTVSVDQSNGDKRKRRVSFHHESSSLKVSELPSQGKNGRSRGAIDGTASKADRNHGVLNIESLDRLTFDILLALKSLMFKRPGDEVEWQNEMENLANHSYNGRWKPIWATRHQRQIFPFIAQSVFFTFSSPRQLLKSFRVSSNTHGSRRSPRLEAASLDSSFQILSELCPWDITLHSFWLSLEKLFIMPEELVSHTHRSRRTLRRANPGLSRPMTNSVDENNYHPEDYVANQDAAYVCFLALYSLISSIPRVDIQTWRRVSQMRSSGEIVPDHGIRKASPDEAQRIISIMDKFEDDLALRLSIRLARVISARAAFHEISKAGQMGTRRTNKREKANVNGTIMEYLRSCCPKTTSKSHRGLHTDDDAGERPLHPGMIAVEWLRTVLLKEWDSNPEITRSSAAGGALQLLTALYQHRSSLNLMPEDFHTPFLRDRLNPMDMPAEWLSKTSNNKTIHLLTRSFLFPPSIVVNYFRAMNYSIMSKSYESTVSHERHWKTIEAAGTVTISDEDAQRIEAATQSYILIVVRREEVLRDALDQLWRREKRELMRPLKVIMGMHEGEQGIDHGGVQQEFFRVALIEALNPDFGAFAMSDSQTRSSWFQPGCLEPLYKFELLGLLVSLALYNGLTLAVNFPIALYMKLLDMKVRTTNDIRDGWPDLARGFDDLLSWEDGDVGDVFMRTYEFSYEAYGSVVSIDMQKHGRNWPLPSIEREQSGVKTSYGPQEYILESVEGDYPYRRGSISWDSDDNGNIHPSAPERLPRADGTGRVSGILKGSSAHSPVSAPLSHENLSAKEDQELAQAPLQTNDERGRWDSTEREQPHHQQREEEEEEEEEEEAALVTNENREQYVKDYIYWLTDKSIRPQYEAFARGFYTCLDRTALSIFTPEALKRVVEGIQYVEVEELMKYAKYSGDYYLRHPTVLNFWEIMKSYSQEKRRALLEFVTASDRIPVNGIASMNFVIQKNGDNDTRLPTSMTCYGRLLLPDYSSREVLEEKLEKALENVRGFGSP